MMKLTIAQAIKINLGEMKLIKRAEKSLEDI